ncbi:hypothetical protein KC347_g248 [Hortaea werneckii]|nr:hypothetical protein KC347_g248 [Hortaea werneckii]
MLITNDLWSYHFLRPSFLLSSLVPHLVRCASSKCICFPNNKRNKNHQTPDAVPKTSKCKELALTLLGKALWIVRMSRLTKREVDARQP